MREFHCVTAPSIRYEIAVREPHRHLFDVALIAGGSFDDSVEVRMPVWSPGSYLIREYARNVQDVTVSAPDGRPLSFEKVSKNAWRIDGAAGGFAFRFRLYANEPNVQSPHLDDTHGFIHPPAVCPWIEGYSDQPCDVALDLPDGWRIATGLEPVAGKANTFRASDYDELLDCPIECGDFVDLQFKARRRPHRIVISGGGTFDEKALLKETRRIVETVIDFWGGAPPYRHYTFICHVYPGSRGGLEHRNSTVLGIDAHSFHPRKKYEDQVLTLIAHEFFHTWSVKRIRPAALGPFDYGQENYTRLLWVFEGITSYYDNLLVVRAGLMPAKRYFKNLSDFIGKLHRTPGRLRQSLAESSFDTWIKFYRQNEHSPNALVNYYLKGMLVGLLLDLHVREKTDGRVSLDDVMRELWRRYQDDGAGIGEAEFEAIAAEVSGLDLRRFFRRAVHSAEELDFNAALRPFGLRLVTKRKGEASENGDGPTPWIGVETDAKDNAVAIRTVYEASPAERAGLSAGDIVLAVDGLRVTPDTFKARLRAMTPGRSVDIAFFRRDRLRSATLKIDRTFETEMSIEPVADAGERTRRLRDAWLGSALESDAG